MTKKKRSEIGKEQKPNFVSPEKKSVLYLPSLISAIVGGIVTGFFTLAVLFYADWQSDKKKLQQIADRKQEFHDELSYNLSLTKESVRGLRNVLEGWKRDNAIYNRNQPFQTNTYDQREIRLSSIYTTSDLNFLINIYEGIRYINKEFEKYNDQYRNDAHDFGEKLAKRKMIEKTEILIDHVLSIQFQIQSFLDGNNRWDSTYYDNLARFRNFYWKIPYDSTVRIELKNHPSRDGNSFPLSAIPIRSDSLRILIP